MSGWTKVVMGFLIGALVPSLVAWGSLGANVKNNAKEISCKVDKEVFAEYKDGNESITKRIFETMKRIEEKIDNR